MSASASDELTPSVSFAVSRGVNVPSARHVRGSGACASEMRKAGSLFVHARGETPRGDRPSHSRCFHRCDRSVGTRMLLLLKWITGELMGFTTSPPPIPPSSLGSHA